MRCLLGLFVALVLSACAWPPQTPAPTPVPTHSALTTHLKTPTPKPAHTPTPVPTPVGQQGGWRLIFGDEFEGQKLDTTKWSTCWSYGCATTNPSIWYSAANVLVGNGIVQLRADNQRQFQYGRIIPYTSGMLSTGGGLDGSPPRFTTQYGYFEARARVPAGRGLWPAFWMLTPAQQPPEIDIMEVLSKEPTRVQLHYHYLDGSGATQDYGTAWAGGDFSTGWHTFGLEWQPDTITWYVDGVQRNQYQGDYVAAEPLYLILNLQVGGNDSWSGPADATTVFPAYYDIDYVRVWQRTKP